MNIVAAPARRTRAGLGIYVHADTAPPGEGWTHPPLTLTRDGDRLYGRGAADMKGTVAAILGLASCGADDRIASASISTR